MKQGDDPLKILSGRSCLITGASGGLGASLAHTFWEEGANLLLVARRSEALHNVARALPKEPAQQVLTLVADLADPDAPQVIHASVLERMGKLDILINNAALQGPIGPIWENDWEDWCRTIRVNLLSIVGLCRLCVPLLKKSPGGKIINVSGGGGAAARPNFTAYATAKAGLVRFSETLAQEVHAAGIDVNCIAPGALSTAMTEEVLRAGALLAGEKEHAQAQKIKERGRGETSRAVSLCLFLASRRSDGITGKLISAVWDAWETLPEHLEELQKTDIFTLRRIVPKDRGYDWEKN